MALVDNAVYVGGRRTGDPHSLEETYKLLRERHGMAWIGLYRPDVEEIRSVAQEFRLHHLAVEDAVTAHQRAKLERYGPTLFTVLRPARYLDAEERVEFGEHAKQQRDAHGDGDGRQRETDQGFQAAAQRKPQAEPQH